MSKESGPPTKIVLREGSRTAKRVWLIICDDGPHPIRLWSARPAEPNIILSREEALKLSDAIRAAFPLDALGRV